MAKHYGALPPGDPCGSPEDCGAFCVWWYTQVDEKRWAYALRSTCGTYWHTSSPKSGFSAREEAILAGNAAVRS